MTVLCQEYAVDPRSIRTFEDFRYLFEKFGFWQGRLIVKCPGDWERRVLDACADPTDRIKIQEKLRRAAARRVIGAPMLGAEKPTDWPSFVSAVHRRTRLAGAVTDEEVAPDREFPPVIRLAEWDEDGLAGRKEERIRRTADEISQVAATLLRHSPRVVLIDPYFDVALLRYRESLKKILEIARRERCEYVDIVAGARDASESAAISEIRRQLPTIYDASKIRPRLRFLFLTTPESYDDFHHRFILSEFGAIRFDAGLDAAGPNKWTDIVLVDRIRHLELVERYIKHVDREASYACCWPEERNGYRFVAKK
jgi:hypothetical protein